jgi:hypothetical protein
MINIKTKRLVDEQWAKWQFENQSYNGSSQTEELFGKDYPKSFVANLIMNGTIGSINHKRQFDILINSYEDRLSEAHRSYSSLSHELESLRCKVLQSEIKAGAFQIQLMQTQMREQELNRSYCYLYAIHQQYLHQAALYAQQQQQQQQQQQSE